MIDLKFKQREAAQHLRRAGSAFRQMSCDRDNPDWKYHTKVRAVLYSLSNFFDVGKTIAKPTATALRDLAEELEAMK